MNILSSVTTTFENIKKKITEPIEKAKELVTGAIEKIKGLFPLNIGKIMKLKIPHITIDGGEAPYGLGGLGRKPHIGVEWHAKAMQNPYLFTAPTVMQTPYGMIGAGEAGNELMYGHDALMRDIETAQAANNETLVNGVYHAMVAALDNADLKVVIGRREFGRIVREVT